MNMVSVIVDEKNRLISGSVELPEADLDFLWHGI
jgi:hypothetical protein